MFNFGGGGHVLTKHTHVLIWRRFLFHYLSFLYLKCIQSEQKRHEVMGRLELALEELSAERSKSSAILSALHDFTGVAGVHLAPSDAEEGRARSADGGLEVDFSGSGARANGSGSSSATGWNFRERAEGVGDSWRLASNFAMNSGGLSVPSAKDFIGNVPWSVCVPGGSAPATILK